MAVPAIRLTAGRRDGSACTIKLKCPALRSFLTCIQRAISRRRSTSLAEGIDRALRHQTLLGVTGSGKTFTMANVVEKVQRPTLVLAHNKTLAAQLAIEFREFFPNNAVEYFVSYYDYYQPEAYLPRTDTYIEKDADINEQLDKLRHAATRALSDKARCADSRLGLVHLRTGISGGVPELRSLRAQGGGQESRQAHPPIGGYAV